MNTGTSLTLSDQKAILFYLGFFPAFISLSALSVPDAMINIGVMAVAPGGAKPVYVYLAVRE